METERLQAVIKARRKGHTVEFATENLDTSRAVTPNNDRSEALITPSPNRETEMTPHKAKTMVLSEEEKPKRNPSDFDFEQLEMDEQILWCHSQITFLQQKTTEKNAMFAADLRDFAHQNSSEMARRLLQEIGESNGHINEMKNQIES
jgi:hypothetical protein